MLIFSQEKLFYGHKNKILTRSLFCLGYVAHVPDLLVIAAQNLAPVHHAELVVVPRGHQGNKIVVLAPKVHYVEDLVQDRVQSPVQNHDSLVPGLVLNLIQGHRRIRDLVLGLPSKEGPWLQTREAEMSTEIMMALHKTTNQILMTMEQKTMCVIRHSMLFLLWLLCSNQFLLSVFFQALLLFWRRGVSFCCRAWREWNGRPSVLGRDSKPLVCNFDLTHASYLPPYIELECSLLL